MSAENELSIYDDVEGKGFENMGADKFSIPMLKIAQPTSSIVTEDGTEVKAGDFYNSITGKSYGTKIEVIPVYFNSVWLEWKPNMGGLVARHKPYSIPVEGDAFTGMHYNGNDVQDSWCYLVLIKGHEDEGVIMLSCTSTNIKYAKIWNGLMNDSRLPSGKHAPLFAYYWQLESKKNKNDKGTFFVLGEAKTAAIKKGDMVPKEIYLSCVKGAVEIAPQSFENVNMAATGELPAPADAEETTGDDEQKY